MFRVVALGYCAGEIIDRLRATGTYEDIRFVLCDTEEELAEARRKAKEDSRPDDDPEEIYGAWI